MVSCTEDWMFLLPLCACWTADNHAIRDEGAIGIAKGLEKNTSLKELGLGRVFSAHYLFIHYCISSYPCLFWESFHIPVINME
jgi:hypothetical protein